MRFALLLALVLSGCISTQARQEALFPPLISTYQGISQDVAYGIQAKAEPTSGLEDAAASFGQALQSRDVAVVALQVPSWLMLRDVAEYGIDAQLADGVVGPGVASSLRTRLKMFEAGLVTLLAGLPQAATLTP